MAHAIRPGHEDARLLVNLAQWQSTVGVPAALRWLWSNAGDARSSRVAQRYRPGSDGDGHMALLCDFFDTLGVLHKHGLLNEDLLFDWLPVSRVWDRVREYVLGRRCEGDSALWSNFEALAAAHKRLLGEYST